MSSFASLLAIGLVFALPSLSVTASGEPQHTLSLGNDHIKRTFARIDGAWRTTAVSRADGTDSLALDSDEFHILFFNDNFVTVYDYQTVGDPALTENGGEKELVIRYGPREDRPIPPEAPLEITVTHRIGVGRFMRKTVDLVMPGNFSKQIDRIEVERFSTPATATRGGRGQPVFLDGRWFVGIEHPSARTRHTDGNTPADNSEYGASMWGARLAWLADHSAEGRDADKHARNGLVRCMHFPAYPTMRDDGKHHLTSKSSVIGTSAPGDTLELGFIDYFRGIQRQPKRLSHYNNWYDKSGKDLSIPNFVDRVLATYDRCFSPYGVRVDSMVPDNFNWHNEHSLYQPNPRFFPNGDADLRRLNEALMAKGSRLGLWLTLSGNNGINPAWARENGYQWGPGGHFLLANPENKAAMKQRLKELIKGVGVNYFKHDFNTLRSRAENGHAPDARHGHEAETDAMLELLRWEYECDPELFVNVTSGTWFSPWLLAECNSIWMLSHDDGAGESGPEPSNFTHQQSYRDEVIQVPWGNPATRPLIPVSQLMTHGIICGPHSVSRRYNNIAEDSLCGWASGVMLYHMRGTLLQEWYITPQDLSRAQWDALGRASRWSMENQAVLVNSVFWGGDPAAGEPFGYAAWNGDRGIISMRNSRPVPRRVSIPFDRSVWYRGESGVNYRAEVVFPWHNEWPASFVSGKPIEITIPPFTVMVMHLEPGASRGGVPALVDAIPVAPGIGMAEGLLRSASFEVPSREMTSCQLMVTAHGAEWPEVRLDGQPVRHLRSSWSTNWQGATGNWRARCYDLLPYQGRRVKAEVTCGAGYGPDTSCDLLMIQDQAAGEPPGSDDVRLPLPVSQGSRRAVAVIAEGLPLVRGKPLSVHPLFGRWFYRAGGRDYSREFTADGQCVLREGERIIWTKPCNVTSGTSIMVEGDAEHELKTSNNDGHWETYLEVAKGRYKASPAAPAGDNGRLRPPVSQP